MSHLKLGLSCRRSLCHAGIMQAFLLTAVLGAPAHASAPCGSWSFSASPVPVSGYSTLAAATALSSSDAWAVGYTAGGTETLTQHWGGSSWSIIPSPNPSSLQGQTLLFGVDALSTDDVWAVGLYTPSGGAGQTLAIHWNGSAWSQVSSPDIAGGSSLNAVSALASSDMWAVGVRAASSPGPAEVPLAAHWDGSMWTEVAAPFVGNRINRLYGVSARTSGDVWAVGTWKNTTSSFHILILHWDGSVWSVSSAPDPGVNDQLLSVVSLAADDTWAVGERLDPVDGSQPLIMHRSGSTWTTVALPVFPNEFNRLNSIRAAAPDDIWAAGATAEVAGGPSRALLMHWDGVLWSTVAAGPSDGSSEYFGGLALAPGCDGWAVGSYLSGDMTVPFTERLQSEAVAGVPDGGAGSGVIRSLAVSPNPASGQARIAVVLSQDTTVRADVFDVRGRVVRTGSERSARAGQLHLTWDGRDDGGSPVAPGLYFFRVRAGGVERSARFMFRP